MLQDYQNKNKKICIIGLGYVGLPMALAFARKFKVIGFDINKERIAMMNKGVDPSRELGSDAFDGCDIVFTNEPEEIREASFYIVAVPTPIDRHKKPDISLLLKACRIVGSVLKKGDYVVFESTVYPGCTEEDCIPVLEKESGLKFISDFKAGYSPERINPGDREHTFTRITKVVSGCDEESLAFISEVYGSVVTAGVYKASSIRVAEAAKIIENTQRDLNIALVNELSLIFRKMNINTYEVLEAAGTKWNFLPFRPGLVGGHCIGVDPYYLTWKSDELGYHPRVILAGREINDSMGARIAREVVQHLIQQEVTIKGARVLIMGATFKENVSDIRNSKVVDIVNELQSYLVDVEVIDPLADKEEVKREYGYSLTDKPTGKYDAIILAVNHTEYMNWEEKRFLEFSNEHSLFYDVKGAFRNKLKRMKYISL